MDHKYVIGKEISKEKNRPWCVMWKGDVTNGEKRRLCSVAKMQHRRVMWNEENGQSVVRCSIDYKRLGFLPLCTMHCMDDMSCYVDEM